MKVQWGIRRLDNALFSRIVRLPREDGQWSEPTRLVGLCTYWGGRIAVTHCSRGGTVTESLSPELAQRGALVEVTA